jgi:hypothetical protein
MPKRCTKVRYRDRVAAIYVLATAQSRKHTRRAKDERRAYFCLDCKGWHLTSKGRVPGG